jgi:hypothetical protein
VLVRGPASGVASDRVLGRVAAGGEILVAGVLVAVSSGLVAIGARLIAVRERLIGVRARLIVLRNRLRARRKPRLDLSLAYGWAALAFPVDDPVFGAIV